MAIGKWVDSHTFSRLSRLLAEQSLAFDQLSRRPVGISPSEFDSALPVGLVQQQTYLSAPKERCWIIGMPSQKSVKSQT